MTRHIEVICDYIADTESGDLVWNDSHGQLIRCGACLYSNAKIKKCNLHGIDISDSDFCSKGVKK